MRTTLAFMTALAMGATSAQDSSFTAKRNAVGLEVTGLIPMSRSEMSGPAIYPYVLTYRRAIGPGWARFGIGASGWSEQSDGDVNSSALRRERSSWRINTRLGYALPLVNDRRWLVLAGLDVLHASYHSKSRDLWEDNSETKNSYSTAGIGLGLALDAQFRISKRIAIGTEFNLEMMRSETTEDRTYSDDPEYDRHATSESTRLDAIRAFSLFLLAYF